MAKIYYDKDADLGLIKDKTIAIIGYGIQGRGQSLCLRDSGCHVVVSETEGTPNYELAKADGFTPVSAAEAAKAADIIQILTQDHVQAKVYIEAIKPNLKKVRHFVFLTVLISVLNRSNRRRTWMCLWSHPKARVH